MRPLPLIALLLSSSAFASSGQAECESDPDCKWLTNSSGQSHCLCKLDPAPCPPLQPLPEIPESCPGAQLATPGTWSCDAGDGAFTWQGPTWIDGAGDARLVLDERLATCDVVRPGAQPQGKGTGTNPLAAQRFLLDQLAESSAAWVRAQNELVDVARSLDVADDYVLWLELELATCEDDDACLDGLLAKDPKVSLADARRLCGI